MVTHLNRFSTLLAIAIVASQAVSASAADGDIDTTFGVGGLARAGIDDGDASPSGCRPVVQADGKILICGTRLADGATGSDFLVARFNADGTLDTTFGDAGRATIDFDGGSGGDQANGIALQNDGRIVVAGTTWTTDTQSANFAVARLNADGSVDATFGGQGKSRMGFNLDDGTGNDEVRAVVVAPDGSIVVAGSAETTTGADIAVVRLSADGTLDTAFNGSGQTTFAFGLVGVDAESDSASGIAIDASGRIVIAGTASATSPAAISEFGVARLLSDGTLDTSFNGAGVATAGFDPGTGIIDAAAFGVVIGSEGSILVPGYANTSPYAMENMDMAALKLRDDGTRDESFGVDGQVVLPFDISNGGVDAAVAAIAEPDGRVLLVGTAQGIDTQVGAIARLAANGTLDTTFGTDGRRTYDLGLSSPGTQAFTGVAAQDDAIVIGGVAFIEPLGSPQPLDCLVVRLTLDSGSGGSSSGAPDQIFSSAFD